MNSSEYDKREGVSVGYNPEIGARYALKVFLYHKRKTREQLEKTRYGEAIRRC